MVISHVDSSRKDTIMNNGVAFFQLVHLRELEKCAHPSSRYMSFFHSMRV
jgi:hypothetical protein